MITQEYFKKLYSYEPTTGLFIKKYRENCSPEWNAHHVGKTAGMLIKTTGTFALSVDKIRLPAAKCAVFFMTGKWPKRVYFIDGDRLNLKWDNLSLTKTERIPTAKSLKKSARVSGIFKISPSNKWIAIYPKSGKSDVNLGEFESFTDAFFAWNSYEISTGKVKLRVKRQAKRKLL